MNRRNGQPGPIAVSIRAPSPSDAPGLGLMVFAGLFDAPSSPLVSAEAGDDLVEIGQSIVHGLVFGDELVFVGFDAGAPAALARIVPREFVHGAHIGTLQLLVSPSWRRRSIGTQMLCDVMARPEVRERFIRLEMAIAGHDVGSRALLRMCSERFDGPRWELERLEHRAFHVDGGFVDVELWVRDTF